MNASKTANVFWNVTYTYSQKIGGAWNTYSGNMVGRDGRTPIGYGPCGPSSMFTLEELPVIVDVLTEQLGTVPTLTISPAPEW